MSVKIDPIDALDRMRRAMRDGGMGDQQVIACLLLIYAELFRIANILRSSDR